MEGPLSSAPGGREGLQVDERVSAAGTPFRSGAPQGFPTRGDVGPGVQCYLPPQPTGGPGATLDGPARGLVCLVPPSGTAHAGGSPVLQLVAEDGVKCRERYSTDGRTGLRRADDYASEWIPSEHLFRDRTLGD